MKNNHNRKTVPSKTKKNLSNFDKAFNTRNLVHTDRRLVWRSIIEFPTQSRNGTGHIGKLQYSA